MEEIPLLESSGKKSWLLGDVTKGGAGKAGVGTGVLGAGPREEGRGS